MSLNYEMAKYTELTGEDGTKVPISRLGGFLDGYEKGRADAIDEIWKGVVEEYDNDYCPCVDDYMDYQVTLREIDKILRRMKESKE